MDEVKYFEADQNLKNKRGLSEEEKADLNSVLKKRESLVQQITSKGSSFEVTIQQIESLPYSSNFDNVHYELDYLWEQEDINVILDAYNERSRPKGGEGYSYGHVGFLPSFLGARQRKKGEQRDGVSTMVVKWMQDKVSKGEEIELSFQDTLATWAQNIHMAKIGSILSLLTKDKINPGVLAGRLKSDIMASLSFYDSNGHYSNLFKKIALSKKSSFEEVSQAISSLIFFNSHGDNVGYEDSGAYAYDALREIYEKRSEYFFKVLIGAELKLPLEDRDPGYKRSLLLLEGYDVENADDETVVKAFANFVDNNFAYCRWAERGDFARRVSKPLGKSYGFGTYQEEASSEKTFVPYYKQARQRRQNLESSVFADITSDYGVLYVSDNSFKIFEKDHEYELRTQQLEVGYGTLERSTLQFYISALSRCKGKKDFFGMLPHLCAISFLPQEKRKEFDSFFGGIPNELASYDYDFGQREEYIKNHQDDLDPLVDQLKNGGVDLIVKLLEESKGGLEDVAKKEYFGYKDINPDSLDFFLSFYNQSPFNTHPPHHTIYYYAYIRKTLPDEFVSDFETKAGIKFPKEIDAIETYDDFLAIKDGVLHSAFAGLLKSKENVELLHSRLVGLADKIKTKLPKPKYVSLEHFMLESAVPEEKITEEFLSSYSSLFDIKIRANVESKIGFSMAALDVSAQIAFLDFLSRTSEHEINDFFVFLNKYEKEDRVAICSCYLAFSKEKDFSYMIERLCYHEGVGLPLVRHVSKLIGNAQEIKGFLQKEFKTNYEKKNISRVHEKLIKRAYELFLKYNSEVFGLETIAEIESGYYLMGDMDDDLAEEFGFDKGGTSLGGRVSYKAKREQIAKKVEEDCNAELFSQTLFINSFKTLHESGSEFSLEEIESSKFEQLEGGTILEGDISAMRSIYSHNQKESAVHDALLTSFDKKVKDPKTRFNIFKWKDKIQSFVAFSDRGDSLYMSAFNVSPDARGYKIGEAMLDQVVEQEAKQETLTADCDSKLPISAKYIETGWVGTFYWEDKNEEENKSDWVLDIRRDETANNLYWGKSQSKESIITQRTHPETVKVEVAKTQAELPFQLCTKGYVLTRMFKDAGSGLYYGVFEVLHKEETIHG